MVINWSLYCNDKLEIRKEIKKFKYEKDAFLEINDEYGTHKIDFKSKIYEKNDGNVIFRIDFVNNLCIIILDSDKKFETAIDCSWQEKNTTWELSYTLDDENKRIIMELKE